MPIVEGVQVAATEVIVGTAAWTVIEAIPDLVVSCALVAVTFTVPAIAGAVKSPAELMLPPAADQVTTELKLPVPCTVALHCDVACTSTAEGVHETATEAMEDDGGGGLLLEPPPPQAVASRSVAIATRSYRDEVFTDEWFGFRSSPDITKPAGAFRRKVRLRIDAGSRLKAGCETEGREQGSWPSMPVAALRLGEIVRNPL